MELWSQLPLKMLGPASVTIRLVLLGYVSCFMARLFSRLFVSQLGHCLIVSTSIRQQHHSSDWLRTLSPK